MKKAIVSLAVLFFSFVSFSQKDKPAEKIPLLFRLDDIGMCHAVNMAAKEVLETGMTVSMSVMVPCPWFNEAVELLKRVGVSAWKVASGELRAQIEIAQRAGLKIDYLDYHMGAAVQTPETRAIVEKLAAEYKVGISRYYDEVEVLGGYAAPYTNKLDTLTTKLKAVQPGGTKLFVVHIGLDIPEMSAMEDLNTFGPKDMSKHREAELRALLSPSFQQLIHDAKYRLVNYRMMNDEKGLNTMKRPSGN